MYEWILVYVNLLMFSRLFWQVYSSPASFLESRKEEREREREREKKRERERGERERERDRDRDRERERDPPKKQNHEKFR